MTNLTAGLNKFLDFFTAKTKRIHSKWANGTESGEHKPDSWDQNGPSETDPGAVLEVPVK